LNLIVGNNKKRRHWYLNSFLCSICLILTKEDSKTTTMGVLAMSHGAWGASFVAVVMSFYTEILVEMLLGTGAPLDAFFLVLSVMLVWILMERSLKQIVSDIAKPTEAAETKRLLSVQTVGGGGTIPEYQYYQYAAAAQGHEDNGWISGWLGVMEFGTKILVVLVFQYGARLLRREWVIVGVTLAETIFMLIILAVLFFYAYDSVERVFRAHQKRAMTQSAMQAIKTQQKTSLAVKKSQV